MAKSIPFLLLLSFLAVRAGGSALGLDIHHRFSDNLRDWARSTSAEFVDWPEKGTPEYYSSLAAHDRALLRRRGLLESIPDLTFAGGNETVQITDFGSLYYAEVSLGTPNVTFLVALDTGSFLTWVPCDCKNCTPAPPSNYRFNTFNSSASSTSKRVPCSSSLCSARARSSCSSATDTCPYTVQYVDGTTTSGVLLQDALHLITDNSQQTPLDATITFGCGQQQANTDIPTGLMGLGRRSISIPSTLAAGGFTADSFSMCFGDDQSGRIRFGDKGSSNQRTTPFNASLSLYLVTVTNVLVGGEPLNAPFEAIFDTGTTFTLLPDPIYTAITMNFDILAKRDRISINRRIPLEFCYAIGKNETRVAIPSIDLVMQGNEVLELLEPVVLVANRNTREIVGFCLALLKGSNYTIIGQNFMTGYKVVFDNERSIIGWNKTDCYNDVSLKAPSPAGAQAPVPVVVSSPRTESDPPVRGNGLSAAPPVLGQPVLLFFILSHFFLTMLFTF